MTYTSKVRQIKGDRSNIARRFADLTGTGKTARAANLDLADKCKARFSSTGFDMKRHSLEFECCDESGAEVEVFE